MVRMFYQMEDKLLFDREAFINMAKAQMIDLSEIYGIFGIDDGIEYETLIEV